MEHTPTRPKLDAVLDRFLPPGTPPAPKATILVVNPAVMQALSGFRTSMPAGRRNLASFMGMDVAEKADQKADCYAFADRARAIDYLNGLITEDQLELLVTARIASESGNLEAFLKARLG